MKKLSIGFAFVWLCVLSIYAQTVSNLPAGARVTPTIRALPATQVVSPERPSLSQSNGPASPDLGIGASSPVPQAIRLLDDGAVADYGLQKVTFPADLTETPLGIITPDGRKLFCRATFLALHDTVSGQSVLLGEVRSSIGELSGDNAVIYPNAFDTISADIRYRYTKYSLEQDIILHEAISVPEEFQTETVQLEVWSEWIDSVPDAKESQAIDLRPLAATGRQPGVAATDEHLKFGAARIGDGYAFSLQNEADKVPVAKTFGRIEGRDWLIERVDFTALKPKLDKLPKSQASLAPEKIKSDRARLVRSLHAQNKTNPSRKPMRMAQARPVTKDSVVLDFIIVSSVPVPADIISWWPGGGNANDVITNNHGALNFNATYAAGKVGQSFKFNGYYQGDEEDEEDDDADYLEISNSPSLNPTNGLTIEAWIHFPATATNQNIPVASKDGGARQYLLTKYANGTIRAHVGITNGNFYYTDGITVLQPDTWYHVAMTYSVASSNLSIYVNGILDTNVVVAGSLITSTEALYIGGAPPWNYYWTGGIDEPSLYSRALSASEILAIYNAGVAGKYNPNCYTAPTDIVAWWPGDGNGYDLARTNFATLSGATYESAIVSQGFSFDGVNDGVTAANDNALNLATTNDNVTIEAWIKPLANSTTYGVMSIAGKRYTPNSSTATGYELYLVNGVPGFQIANGTSVASFSGTNDLRNGYHHLAVTLNRSSTNGGCIYVDGVPKLTFNPTVLSVSLSNNAPVRIGVHPQSGFNGWYKGVIDEATIYRRALTNTEITALYTAGSAGKCKTDTDGDGLTDLQEQFLDTNPNDIDSDDDGLTDGDEVFVYGTNPTVPDSDGDGLSDGNEVLVWYSNPKIQDTDYDGIGDGQEIIDATHPTNVLSVLKVQLGSWRFDSNNWAGLQSQMPLTATNLASVVGISEKAVSVYSNSPATLKYRDVETNGWANINCREGSLRFWFKPAWNSSTTNGGTGPQSEARLLELGNKGVTGGYWGLLVGTNGTNVYFCTQSNLTSSLKTNLSATIRWTSNEWHQIVITYSPTNSALYLDGQALTTTGWGITNYPSPDVRSQGFRIGSNIGGTNQARGRFENLETFNYVLSGADVTNGYSTPCVAAVDVMLVVDHSGSMSAQDMGSGVTRLAAAKQAGSNFITHLNLTNSPGDQVGLTWFDETSTTTKKAALTNNGSFIISKLNDLMPGEGTRIDLGITNAIPELIGTRHKPEALRVMVLLSDGINDGHTLEVTNAANVAKYTNDIRLITVALSTNADTQMMRGIASSTNDYYFATNVSQLDNAYNSIANTLCRLSNSPPTVSITNPTYGQTFTGPTNLQIRATAFDAENGLVKVEFYAGNVKIGEDYHAPFTISWTAPVGTTNLTAVAYDEFNLSTTSAVVSITVTAANPPLTVQFTAPASNQLFVFSPTNILLKTTNTVGTITKMTFYNGSITLGETNAAPYQYLWQNVTNGNYTLKAVGTNSATGVSATNTISIIVNAMPWITNYAPTNLQAFNFIGSVNVGLTNTAWDPDGRVTNVTFYTWSNSIAVPLPGTVVSNNLKYSLTWSGLTNGYYSYFAIAKDTNGAASTSPIGVFKVNPTNTPPTVWITYPTNNEVFRSGADITITADVVEGSGNVTNVEFFSNGQFLGSDSISPYAVTVCCWEPGTYTNITRATDSYGALAVSTNVVFIVGPQVPTLAEGYWDSRFGQLAYTLANFDRGYPHFHDAATDFDSVSIGPDGTVYMIRSSPFNIWPIAMQVEGTNYSAYLMGTDNFERFGGSGYWSAIKTIGTNVYAAFAGNTNSWGHQLYKWSPTDGAPTAANPSLPLKGNWTKVGTDVDGYVFTIEDFGGELYIGGDFTAVFDGEDWNTNVQFVARLNPTNSQWIQVTPDPLDDRVYSLVTLNGKLYAGGCFVSAGTTLNLNGVARLDGANWSSLNNGLAGDADWEFSTTVAAQTNRAAVRSMSGCGNNLFIGGHFIKTGNGLEANGVAIWNEQRGWSTPGGANLREDVVEVRELQLFMIGNAVPGIFSVKAKGHDLFVAGNFTNIVQNGENILNARHIAQATWNENLQTWTWKALDIGVSADLSPPSEDWWAQVYGMDIRNGTKEGETDLFIAGKFLSAGESTLTESVYTALWRGGCPVPASVPVVTITNPISFTVFSNIPTSIVVEGKATSSYTNIVSLDLYTNGVFVQSLSVSPPVPQTNFAFGPITFSKGQQNLKVIATDEAGLKGQSRIVYFSVRDTNSPVSAVGDQFTILMDSGTANLNVLANDLPPTGLRVSQINDTGITVAQIKPGHDGSYVSYLPPANLYGQDTFNYTVTNSNNDVDTATVSITIRAKPGIWISSPTSGNRFRTNTTVTVTGAAWDWDGTATNVIFYVNGTPQATVVPGAVGPITLRPDTNNPAGVLTASARPNDNFTFNWSSSIKGFYTLTAATVCDHGITNTSSPITIVLTNTVVSPNPPTAHISNLAATTDALGSAIPPVIREGLFNLQGQAADLDVGDDVSYQVLLYRPEDWESVGDLSELISMGFEPFADITPGPKNSQGFHVGGDVSGNLGTNDLTAVPNGIYDLLLRVRGGTEEAYAIARVQIESNLKIGQFSFSEQDLTLPVNGIPITVTRTYNSLNSRSAEFGYSWSYALNSMDVEIDEERVTVTALDTLEDVDLSTVNPMNFSMRVGGGRNVTLTLPDGRRTTFQFTYTNTTSAEDAPMCVDGEWIAPPGVTATLTTPNPATKHSTGDDTVVALFSPLQPYWQAGGQFTPLEAYDIPEFVLTTDDGTEYHITRDVEGDEPPTYIYQDSAELFSDNPSTYYIRPHSGKPKLTWIKQRSGDIITISDTEVKHFPPNSSTPTRSIFMQRDAADRITAIFDPNSGVTNQQSSLNSQPLVKYIYNRDTGNLIQVQRLQDRTAGNYLITKYHYDHPQFPHYITSIEDPRGIPLARNEYDDSGKLIAVVDADGKRTAFIHNTTNRVEIVTDRLGNTNSFVYDLRGNVTATTNALGQITTMAYDDFNNKTNDVVFLNGQPYATNQYVFINTNLLQASINALGQSNTFVYGPRGRLEISTDARGFSTTNYYDDTTDNLIATSDALGNVTSNYYSITTSLLLGTRDALGTLTTNIYDELGNLTSTATLDVSGKILSTNSYAYDTNGNQTNSITWRTNSVGSGWLGATNTTIYDAQNNVIQTISPDGGTNSVVYNALGKQDYTVDAGERTNRYAYDAQGRLFQTTYPDGSFEVSYFDAEGRLTNRVDRAGRATIYYFDTLGRMTNALYADNTSTRTIYDSLGRVQFSVDARGVTNAFGYDVLGQRTSVTNALGVAGTETVSRYGYDANGNQLYFTNALGTVTTNLYDALNRLTNVSFADGTKQLTFYDAGSRRIASVDQANVTNRFVYDGAGRVTFVTNALGKVTRYEYDEAGNQTAQIDALNRTNKFEFDSMSRRVKRLLAGNQSETFGYDTSGNLIRHTNFNGVVITNQHDVLNRLTNRSSVSGYQVSYGYSVTGQRTNMTDASGVTSYAYDVRDRLTNCVNAAGELHYRYDVAGNLTNLWSATANGVNVRYAYDSLSRLKTVTNVVSGTPGLAALYGYDAVGNLQTIQYGNNLTNLYRYDVLNRLTNVLWKVTTTTLGDFTYKLGLAGNRTNLTETVNSVSRTYAWKYDAAYRLTEEIISGTAPTGTLGYNYDDVGNRLNRTGTIGSLSGQTFNFDKSDRLDNDSDPATASSLFDANGNTTSYGGTYQYDVENRLLNANSGAVVIVYDGDGNRIKKTVGGITTWYLVATINPSGYAQVVEEKTGTTPTTLSRVYTYGHDLVNQREAGGTVYYFGYDGHGSTRFLMNGSTVANVFAYDSYGTLIASNTTAQTDYLYCGEQFDKDLGFYYLRARYLNASIGRFQTMDSYEGNNNDPPSLHKYLYANADPVGGIDPSGHNTLTELQSVQGTIGVLNSATRLVSGVMRVYDKGKTFMELLGTARRLYNIAAAMQGADAGAVSSVIETQLKAAFGGGDLSTLASGFMTAFSHIGPTWKDTATKFSKDVIPHVATPIAAAVGSRLGEYMKAQSQGKLRFVIFAPSAPAGGYRDTMINVNIKLQIRVSPGGGRLFGIGFHIDGNKKDDDKDQLFRLDYWNYKGGQSFKYHYHVQPQLRDHYDLDNQKF